MCNSSAIYHCPLAPFTWAFANKTGATKASEVSMDAPPPLPHPQKVETQSIALNLEESLMYLSFGGIPSDQSSGKWGGNAQQSKGVVERKKGHRWFLIKFFNLTQSCFAKAHWVALWALGEWVPETYWFSFPLNTCLSSRKKFPSPLPDSPHYLSFLCF